MWSSFKSISKNFILLGALFVFSNLPANAFPHFDYDSKADFAVFRPGDRNWHSFSSEYKRHSAVQWGLATDQLVPGDYDGDGLTDFAVWRPQTGDWFVLRSTDKSLLSVNWGMQPRPRPGVISFLSTDEPVVGDYDGDGTTDFAVWRPDTGVWYVLNSSAGFSPQHARIFQWGMLGDIPVPADYDGDGKTDYAVFRGGIQNQWYIFQSRSNSWKTSNLGAPGSGDLLVPADYTGDGKTDVAVYRGGVWIIERSEDAQLEYYRFGLRDDKPAPADYDGDERADVAVFRRGTWFIRQSSNGQMTVFNFGADDDIPVNSLAVKESVAAIP